jgi:hypothetical protein
VSKASYKAILAPRSGAAGVVVVIAAFKIPWLNWIVDLPGWIVTRFTSIDFHEGEGAFGFILALLLSWLWTSVVVFIVAAWIWRRIQPATSPRR